MRVLVLSQRLPYAPNRGDRLRVYHMIREIASHAELAVASLVHDSEEEAHAKDLSGVATEVITATVPRIRNQVRGAMTLAGNRPLTHVLLDSPHFAPRIASLVHRQRPDVLLAFCSSMARFMFDPALANIPCVLDMIDADSAKWRAMAEMAPVPMRWVYRREARLLARFEIRAMERAFRTLVVNDKERAELLALSPEARIEVIENGVELSVFAPTAPPSSSAAVIFCGVMNYDPNVRGAVWLTREVWPLVRAEHPDARLMLIGATPAAAVRALANEPSGVVVTGTVPDVKLYLWNAAVAVAPLLIARGVQNKVLEAVAAGVPCVVTQPVAEGLPREVHDACRVGADARAFANAICEVLRLSPSARRDMAAKADLRGLAWPGRLEALIELLGDAARRRSRSDAGQPHRTASAARK